MNEDEAKTQPTLETIVEMLKSIQVQTGDTNARLDAANAKLDAMQADIVGIKAEQDRQGRQLDDMSKNLYRFAGDLYELRLWVKEFRQAS